MDGFSNYPPGGWEFLPNRTLDPELYDGDYKQE